MNKKIFNLPKPDPQGKQINYKNILIAIAVLVAIVVLSFTSFKNNKDKGEKKGVTNSSRIEESELSLQQKKCRRLLIQTL